MEGWQFCRPSFFTVMCVSLLLCACDRSENNAKLLIYDGPISEGEDVEMLYSEKENITTKVKAKKVREFQNGDYQFPDGIFIEFYNEQGAITSTLKANSAFYYKAENKWKGVGDVEVKNIEKNEQLNTEELFWFPAKKNISTDKFVQIRTGNEVIYGTGLEAKQDMSEYRIRKVEGEFNIDE
jgi:LPS export ABC transporter protein LptC